MRRRDGENSNDLLWISAYAKRTICDTNQPGATNIHRHALKDYYPIRNNHDQRVVHTARRPLTELTTDVEVGASYATYQAPSWVCCLPQCYVSRNHHDYSRAVLGSSSRTLAQTSEYKGSVGLPKTMSMNDLDLSSTGRPRGGTRGGRRQSLDAPFNLVSFSALCCDHYAVCPSRTLREIHETTCVAYCKQKSR